MFQIILIVCYKKPTGKFVTKIILTHIALYLVCLILDLSGFPLFCLSCFENEIKSNNKKITEFSYWLSLVEILRAEQIWKLKYFITTRTGTCLLRQKEVIARMYVTSEKMAVMSPHGCENSTFSNYNSNKKNLPYLPQTS